eukprot:TRINITY_DN77_c0_g2_i4.p2 TRINITY_DN77_c0_g2~~TRINITY_DN77_c0_g2_i4.p2  ORF type:complete len:178 (+),score=8.48 TRINITY_DN77_c0_g2_i4:112-645(+)
MSSDGSSPYDGWFGIGLAFIVVGVVLFVGCSILLHRVRHCQVIVKRSYFFLVVQHVGMLCYLIVINADTMTGPRHHCDFDTWIALGAFICFALPFFMRIWIYCARYYLTQERKQSGQQSTFFIKRLFLIKPSFLISVWLGMSSFPHSTSFPLRYSSYSSFSLFGKVFLSRLPYRHSS